MSGILSVGAPHMNPEAPMFDGFVDALADTLALIFFSWPMLFVSSLLAVGLAIEMLIQLPG